MSIDYNEKIPNNVDLAGNKTLQRALEQWQPEFLDWWGDMGPEGTRGHGRVPADRDQRRAQGLGAFRLREDARLSLGHFPRPGRRRAQGEFRRAQGRARVAGSARRISRQPAPPDRHAGRHRARLGRAAAPSRPHLPVALRSAEPVPGQRRGRPPPLGDGVSAARLFRPRRARGSGSAARAALGRRRQSAHPRRVQRANARLARVLHVHVLSRIATASSSSARSPNRASIRSRARPASC